MSLERDLRNEQVIHLDLSGFTHVESGTTTRATVELMQQNGHNCALITQNGMIKGIFTDRDVLRKVVDAPAAWDSPIDTVMTPDPVTVNANDPADNALGIMDDHHFRNVPVLDKDGQVIGNLTHYAIIKYLADRFPESVYNLPPDPEQMPDDRAGA
jgi:CBS domain-containing protein